MKFAWDENKRRANLQKHGLDFVYAEDILTAQLVHDFIDDRKDYVEEPHIAYAEVDGIKMCLCYVLRDGIYRVISLRGVHEKEWRLHYGYGDIHVETDEKIEE